MSSEQKLSLPADYACLEEHVWSVSDENACGCYQGCAWVTQSIVCWRVAQWLQKRTRFHKVHFMWCFRENRYETDLSLNRWPDVDKWVSSHFFVTFAAEMRLLADGLNWSQPNLGVIQKNRKKTFKRFACGSAFRLFFLWKSAVWEHEQIMPFRSDPLFGFWFTLAMVVVSGRFGDGSLCDTRS